mgnify:CR=1 FL=1
MMRIWQRRATGVAVVLALLLALPAVGDDAARPLLEAARALNRTTRHWDDRSQTMAMTIVDRRGTEYRRELQVRTKRGADDATRSLMFFQGPAQVRGIGFLQWTDPRGDDRQWLWLPASKRVRQISGGARSESFVGTDFSYEDLAIMAEAVDWDEARAASAVVGAEPVDGQPCDIIEMRPTTTADVTYAAVRLWLGRVDHVVRRFEMRDAAGQVLKTLTLSDVRDEKGIPSAHHLEMRDERSGSRTVVDLTALSYNDGLGDEEFTQRRLERGL